MTRRSHSTTGKSKHWREFIACLLDHRVRFIIIGAHALAVLGVPRNTGDLDVLIAPTKANVERLQAALDDFGFPTSEDIYRLSEGNNMISLGREPHAIQVLNKISGVTFEEAWRGRTKKKINDRTVNFLGRKVFVKNKLAAGRTKDLDDVRRLREFEDS